MSCNTNRSTRADPGSQIDNTSNRASSSEEALEGDDDYTSSSGSSTEDDESQSTEQPQLALQTNKPPTMFPRNNELKSRLETFLPQFQRANQELQAEGDAQSWSIEAQEGVDHYVEMDLALGVLVERQPNDNDVKIQDGTDDSDHGTEEELATKRSSDVSLRQRPGKKPKIQEI